MGIREIIAERMFFIANRSDPTGASKYLNSFCAELCFQCLYLLDPAIQIRLLWRYACEYLSIVETFWPDCTQERLFLGRVDRFLSDKNCFDYNLHTKHADVSKFAWWYLSLRCLYESCNDINHNIDVTAKVIRSFQYYVHQKQFDILLATDYVFCRTFRNLQSSGINNLINVDMYDNNIIIDTLICREWSILSLRITDILKNSLDYSLEEYRSLDKVLKKWKEGLQSG